jgi:hypothetical protein
MTSGRIIRTDDISTPSEQGVSEESDAEIGSYIRADMFRVPSEQGRCARYCRRMPKARFWWNLGMILVLIFWTVVGAVTLIDSLEGLVGR